MIERIVENWLDNSTELSFQGPFCSMLSADGYTVVHLSRHCGMELGKDVLAVAPDGTPCAYQLKTAAGGKISLRQWREEISKQVFDLVTGRIVHPSINSQLPHRAFLVTNGMIEEEVSRAIDDMNRNWQLAGQQHLRLETIVRGQLLEMGGRLDSSLWPSELTGIQKLLQLFLMSGDEVLPRGIVAGLFEEALPFQERATAGTPSAKSCTRAISSAALICALACSKFSARKNHVAEIEAWTIYSAYVLALAIKYDLNEKAWKSLFEVAIAYIGNRLVDLAEEMKSRNNLLEGHLLGDQLFVRARRTWLAGLMAILGLWREPMKDAPADLVDFVREFCHDAADKLHVWGEGAIPQVLSLYWFLRVTDATRKPDDFLFDLLRHVTEANQPQGTQALPDPYHELSEVLGSILGVSSQPITDNFTGRSHSLESLVHIYTRRNWKQHMKMLWPQITHIAFESYVPADDWRFFSWRDTSRASSVSMIQPTHTQPWSGLCEIANKSGGDRLPERAKSYPIFVLLFLIVFPHRLTSDVSRWLDTQFFEG